jgi:hypothetical protein
LLSRVDWLEQNLWWAVCGDIVDKQSANGSFSKGTAIFRKYVWDPPQKLAAEVRAEAQQRELGKR